MAGFGRILLRYLRDTGESLGKLNQLDFFPLRSHLRGYDKGAFFGDARAGFNVAMLAFPQGIAYALIAGLPIEYGLFGSAIAALVGAFFGGSRFIMQGPTNATAVTLFVAFAALGATEAEKLAYLPMLLLMVGVFLMVGAYLRVANLIQFISRTVVTAYITAAATLIMANQVRNALGFQFGPDEQGTTFFHICYLTIKHLPETQMPALMISVIAAIAMIILKQFFRSLPNVAITLILLSVVGFFMEQNGFEFMRLNAVSASSWDITLPALDWNTLSQLTGTALAIALLCVLEGTSIGNSLAARAGSRLDANQEMFSIGAANLGCGLLNGMPASGSLTRSALAFDSGNRTPMASFFTGIIVILALVLVGGFIQYIPRPALAVVVIFIGISLINAKSIQMVIRSTSSDRITFWATFLSGMILPLDDAIYLGVGISIALFLRKVGQPEMVEYVFDEKAGELKALGREHSRPIDEISIVHVEGDLFFGAAGGFYEQMRRVCDDPKLKVMILKMRNAHHLDATSMMALEELISYMSDNGRTLLISEARDEVIRVLADSGLLERVKRRNVFPDVDQNPTLSTARALRRARKICGPGSEPRVSVYGSNPPPAPAGA